MSDTKVDAPAARTDARVMELEIRSAFQDQKIEALDEVVREFADRVRRLERELGELRAQVLSTSEERALGPADDRPPHY
jgi:uncharacterized coiled-coil protein SlyX